MGTPAVILSNSLNRPVVFISSSTGGLEIAREIGRQLQTSLTVTVWAEGAFYPGKTVPESLAEVADEADFAVFILTADDVAAPRNIVFELGFLAGTIGLSRTFLIVADRGGVALPSDLAGVMYLPFPGHPGAELRETIAPLAAAVRKVTGELGIRVARPSHFSSSFISYQWNDKDFAAQLHDDLKKVGVGCWLDAKDAKTGESIVHQIDRAIQPHDKVLLVLSNGSVHSSWVREEVGKAIGLERARHKTVLFPLRLDDAVLCANETREIDRLIEHSVIDFSGWQDPSQYQRAFSKLVRDLVISASVESETRI